MSVTPVPQLRGRHESRSGIAPLRSIPGAAGAPLAWGLLGFAVAIGLAVAVPPLLGYEALTVLSGSMTPTLRVGDVVVDRRVPAADARVGDVVSFRSPEDRRRVITHRIVRLRVDGVRILVVTRGDANTGVERWSIPADGTMGRVVYRIPKLGYAANLLGSRFGRLGFLVLPALLLGAFELRRIWAPREVDDDDGA